MFIVASIAILAVLICLIFNSGLLFYRLLKQVYFRFNPIVFGSTFAGTITLVLLLFIFGRKSNSIIPRFLIKLSHYGVGVLAYLIIFANITALVLVICKITRLISNPRPKSVAICALIVCTSLIVGVSAYGIINGNDIDTVKYTVSIDDENTEGLKLVLISDLHIGYMIDENYLKKAVSEINKVTPDLVCITGDIFDGDMSAISNKEEIKRVLSSIDSKYGVYACFGNHDAGKSFDEMVAFLSETNIVLLQDEYAVIDNRLILAGRRDSSPIGNRNNKRVPVKLPENTDLPVIVLDHQPTNISEYSNDVDLVLCGHTHSGQMFPITLIVKGIYDAPYGYYRENADSPQVIVTSGVGSWGPPFRVGSDNEIVEITLD